MTHLPQEHLYTQSHSWLAPVPEEKNQWRAGYTKFALRMLGEIVDVQLERKEGEMIGSGEIIGSIEGFKAISDLFCVGNGRYVRSNPVLAAGLDALSSSPYEDGWLYQFEGTPDPRALDVTGYRNLLDATIDRMLQKESESKNSS